MNPAVSLAITTMMLFANILSVPHHAVVSGHVVNTTYTISDPEYLSLFLNYRDSYRVIEYLFSGADISALDLDEFDIFKVNVTCVTPDNKYFSEPAYVLHDNSKFSDISFIMARPRKNVFCYVGDARKSYQRLTFDGRADVVVGNGFSRVVFDNERGVDMVIVIEKSDGRLVPKVVYPGPNTIYVSGKVENVYLYDGLNLYRLSSVNIRKGDVKPFDDRGVSSQPDLVVTPVNVSAVLVKDIVSDVVPEVRIDSGIRLISDISTWPIFFHAQGIMTVRTSDGEQITRNIVIGQVPVIRHVAIVNGKYLYIELVKPVISNENNVLFDISVNSNRMLVQYSVPDLSKYGFVTCPPEDAIVVDISNATFIGINKIKVIIIVEDKTTGLKYTEGFSFLYYNPPSRNDVIVSASDDHVTISLAGGTGVLPVTVIADNGRIASGVYILPNSFYMGDFNNATVYVCEYKFAIQRKGDSRHGSLALLLIPLVLVIFLLRMRKNNAVTPILPGKGGDDPCSSVGESLVPILSKRLGHKVRLISADADGDDCILTYTDDVGNTVIVRTTATGDIISISVVRQSAGRGSDTGGDREVGSVPDTVKPFKYSVRTRIRGVN